MTEGCLGRRNTCPLLDKLVRPRYSVTDRGFAGLDGLGVAGPNAPQPEAMVKTLEFRSFPPKSLVSAPLPTPYLTMDRK